MIRARQTTPAPSSRGSTRSTGIRTPAPSSRRPFGQEDSSSPFPISDFERGPTSSELSTWERLLKEHRKSGRALDMCALFFQNAVIMHKFAVQKGVVIQTISPELEQQYISVKATYDRLTRAIRGVQDHTLGVRFRGGDVDILAPDEETANEFGTLPLIIIGVVVIVAAVAVAIWATKKALEISQQARSVIQKADARFCADPDSQLCADWKQEKRETVFERNETLADTITAGVSRVGGSLVMGVILLLGVSMLWRRK